MHRLTAARKRLLAASCGLAVCAVLGLLAFDRLSGDASLIDLGRQPIYAITQTGNRVLVEVVSPVLY